MNFKYFFENDFLPNITNYYIDFGITYDMPSMKPVWNSIKVYNKNMKEYSTSFIVFQILHSIDQKYYCVNIYKNEPYGELLTIDDMKKLFITIEDSSKTIMSDDIYDKFIKE